MKNAVVTGIVIETNGQEQTLRFTCPRCGRHGLELVQTGIMAYICARCRYVLDDVHDEDELVEWLKNHNGNSQESLSE